MSFYDEFQRYSWDGIRDEIYSRTGDDVQDALSAGTPGMDNLISLLSPEADRSIEEIAGRAQKLTEQRFGRVVQQFLYLLQLQCRQPH
jgi:2-iminoacetate synthase